MAASVFATTTRQNEQTSTTCFLQPNEITCYRRYIVTTTRRYSHQISELNPMLKTYCPSYSLSRIHAAQKEARSPSRTTDRHEADAIALPNTTHLKILHHTVAPTPRWRELRLATLGGQTWDLAMDATSARTKPSKSDPVHRLAARDHLRTSPDVILCYSNSEPMRSGPGTVVHSASVTDCASPVAFVCLGHSLRGF